MIKIELLLFYKWVKQMHWSRWEFLSALSWSSPASHSSFREWQERDRESDCQWVWLSPWYVVNRHVSGEKSSGSILRESDPHPKLCLNSRTTLRVKSVERILRLMPLSTLSKRCNYWVMRCAYSTLHPQIKILQSKLISQRSELDLAMRLKKR